MISKFTSHIDARIYNKLVFPLYLIYLKFCFQDVLENDDIKLDVLFKNSLISDLVNVNLCSFSKDHNLISIISFQFSTAPEVLLNLTFCSGVYANRQSVANFAMLTIIAYRA